MHYVVMGLGISGLASVRFLLAQGHRVQVIDTREAPPNLAEFQQAFPDIQVDCGRFSQSTLASADEIILSPGISPEDPSVAQHRDKLISEIELFARQAKAPILAITGTNGKSTVTTMLGELCKAAGLNAAVGGNLGTAALDLLAMDKVDVYVLELSSFQLETTYSLQAHAACILNISPDHLDRHENMAAYIAAKHKIYQGAEYCIHNLDDKSTYPSLASKRISFSLHDTKADFYYADGALWHVDEKLCDEAELYLKGKQNIANALAALAMASSMALDLGHILNALKAFKGLAHRCEWVRRLDEADWINDSKGTNVGASIAAIEGFGRSDKNLIYIAGGQGKGQDFAPLADPAARFVRHAILFGEDKAALAQALQPSTSIHTVDDLNAATQLARELSQAGDTILFSPACASFDMFQNFAARGDAFKLSVEKLA